MNAALAAPPNSKSLFLDKPIYTLSVASEILETHPRTLMMYENLNMIKPKRTLTNRRRYSQRDIMTLQAIQQLTRLHGVNLAGVRHVFVLVTTLMTNNVPVPEEFSGVADLLFPDGAAAGA